jgi:hypothetical protein
VKEIIIILMRIMSLLHVKIGGKGMKYYCTLCRGVIEFGVVKNLSVITEKRCCLCYKQTIVPIPDYETPRQYEKRTGREFSNEGAVWFRPKNGSADFVWGICRYITAKECGDRDIVIADPPVPPPDGWRPQ